MRTLESRLTSPLAFGALVLAALIAWAALFTSAAWAGNRGTVKVHDLASGTETTDRRNEPQVCDYTLHFFGGNPGEAGAWRVEAWPPTGDRTVVDGGTYVSDADGNATASQNMRLPNGHYKLFWGTVDDHAKHKVFKVSCVEAPPGG